MGSGAKNFQSFEILTAANVNDYLMKQSVISLPGSSSIGTAGTAIGTATTATLAPAEGMVVYLQDSNQFQMNLDGSASAWYPIAGQMPSFNGKQTGAISTPTSGTKYTLTYSSTTIRGGFTEASGEVTVPYTGWYQVSSQINWLSGAAATRDIIISWYDGAAWNEIFMTRSHMTATGAFYQSTGGQIYLNAGQKIRTQGAQYTGSVNISGAVIPCGMVINYLGA